MHSCTHISGHPQSPCSGDFSLSLSTHTPSPITSLLKAPLHVVVPLPPPAVAPSCFFPPPGPHGVSFMPTDCVLSGLSLLFALLESALCAPASDPHTHPNTLWLWPLRDQQPRSFLALCLQASQQPLTWVPPALLCLCSSWSSCAYNHPLLVAINAGTFLSVFWASFLSSLPLHLWEISPSYI